MREMILLERNLIANPWFRVGLLASAFLCGGAYFHFPTGLLFKPPLGEILFIGWLLLFPLLLFNLPAAKRTWTRALRTAVLSVVTVAILVEISFVHFMGNTMVGPDGVFGLWAHSRYEAHELQDGGQVVVYGLFEYSPGCLDDHGTVVFQERAILPGVRLARALFRDGSKRVSNVSTNGSAVTLSLPQGKYATHSLRRWVFF